jgi:hypothetical protein
MPPIDIVPAAAGAAPAVHVAANYEEVGHLYDVPAAAQPVPEPAADDRMVFSDELVLYLRPYTTFADKNSTLNARLLAHALRFKVRSRMSPRDFDLALPGSIARAVAQAPHYRVAAWSMTHDPQIARSQEYVKDGYWSYPAVTWNMVRCGDASVWGWIVGRCAPRTRYEL